MDLIEQLIQRSKEVHAEIEKKAPELRELKGKLQRYKALIRIEKGEPVFNGEGVQRAVEAAIFSMPDSFHGSQVYELILRNGVGLGLGQPKNQVVVALYRAEKKGLVEKIGRNMWKARE